MRAFLPISILLAVCLCEPVFGGVGFGGQQQGGSWGQQPGGGRALQSGGGGSWGQPRGQQSGSGWGGQQQGGRGGPQGGWGHQQGGKSNPQGAWGQGAGRSGGAWGQQQGGRGQEGGWRNGRSAQYGATFIDTPEMYGYEASIPGAESRFVGYRNARSGAARGGNDQTQPHQQGSQGSGWGQGLYQ